MSDKPTYESLDEVAAAFRDLPGVVSVKVEERTIRLVTTVVKGTRGDRQRVFDKEAEVMGASPSGTRYEFRVELRSPEGSKVGSKHLDRKINVKPSTERKVNPAKVADALGAEGSSKPSEE